MSLCDTTLEAEEVVDFYVEDVLVVHLGGAGGGEDGEAGVAGAVEAAGAEGAVEVDIVGGEAEIECGAGMGQVS